MNECIVAQFLLRHGVYHNGGEPSEVISRNTELDNRTATTTAINQLPN